ncbi:MAG: hypothetical protein H8E35_01145 [Ardenticatenia bacterium]|nr:hypothetical protein [Ardenticatenia bacterium]
MAILDTPGKRIRALRHDLGVSQIELGHRIARSSGYMSLVEADKVPGISGALLSEIAEVLGTTVDYLLLRSDDPLPPPEMQPDDLDPEVARLVRLIEGLPSHLQDRAITYLEQQLETFERLFAGERQRSREPS